MTIPTACPFPDILLKSFSPKEKKQPQTAPGLVFYQDYGRILFINFILENQRQAGMQQLILLRHAKSDWSVGDGTDFSRPLAPRGERELPVIASPSNPIWRAGLAVYAHLPCVLAKPLILARHIGRISNLSMKKASIMPRSGYYYIILKRQKRQQIRCLLLAIIPASASFCAP